MIVGAVFGYLSEAWGDSMTKSQTVSVQKLKEEM
jgi:hypothetical protein